MAAYFKKEGLMIDYTPSSAVTAGDVIVQGELVGIATHDIAANALGAIAVEGVFQMVKLTGDGGITAGAIVYWDVADGAVTTDSDTGTNKILGVCIATVTTETTVMVKLGNYKASA